MTTRRWWTPSRAPTAWSPCSCSTRACSKGRWPSANRAWYLLGCLRALDAQLRGIGGGSWSGPATRPVVVPQLAAEVGADAVLVTREVGPYGRRRDRAVAAALAARRPDLPRASRPAPGRAGVRQDRARVGTTPCSRRSGGPWAPSTGARSSGAPRADGHAGPGPRPTCPSPDPTDHALPAPGRAGGARPPGALDRRRARRVPRATRRAVRRRHLASGRGPAPGHHLGDRGGCGRGRATRPGIATPGVGSSAGASSITTCCGIDRSSPETSFRPTLASAFRSESEPIPRRSPRGRQAARASRSSTPRCASSWRPAGCPTAAGWWSRRS